MQPRSTCKKCGVKKYRKFLEAIGSPQRGGWGHTGYWVCKNKEKCRNRKENKKEHHIENRGE